MTPPQTALTTTDTTAPRMGSLCTGYAGLDMGVAAALGGARLTWVADNDPDIARLLAARFPGVPNLGDLSAIDWDRVAPIEVMTAGIPCQDISAAGRGAGIEKGTHSGVWTHAMDAVRLLRPGLFVVENVAALRWKGRGLDRILTDLARAGYDTQWCSLRASDIGACHRRERVFLAAHPRGQRRRPRTVGSAPPTLAPPAGPRRRCGVSPAPHGGRTPGHHCTHAQPGAGRTAAHAAGQRRHQGQSQPARIQGRPHPVLGNRAYPHPHRPAHATPHPTTTEAPATGAPGGHRWGRYAPAVHRWEHVLGAAAPDPTEPGRRGRPRLSPRFVEWLMGVPGWVTDPHIGLSRTAQLRALGNGVIPLQAQRATTHLLTDITTTRPAGAPPAAQEEDLP